MQKAIILYQSKNGTTRQLGLEIGKFFEHHNVQAETLSVEGFKERDLDGYDYVFLGCWTKGLMLFAQHPDKCWSDIVSTLKIPEQSKLALFTTYKIATGSMFAKMRKSLPDCHQLPVMEIKSRDKKLPEKATALLNQQIG